MKVYEGTAVRITYTAVNEEHGLSAAVVQTVLFSADEKRLAEKYPDMYTSGKASGDLSIIAGTNNIVGESSGLHLQNAFGDASGVFQPSQDLYLGASNDNLRFVVYNNGSKPVSLWVNGNGQTSIGDENVVLAPGSYLVFNGIMFGYEAALQGWNIISQDKYLLPITFRATSDAAVDLYIGRFTVNENSFAPQVSIDDFGKVQSGTPIELKDYITVSGMEKVFSYTISYSSDENGNFEQTASGNSDGVTTYTPDKAGWYIVEYRVEYDGDAITVSKKFQAVGRELVLTNIPEDVFAAVGEYTVTPPVSEQGTVTWKAELFEIFFLPGSCGNLRTDINGNGYVNGVKTGTGVGTVYVYENLAVRITYTVTDSEDTGNTASIYRTVINYTDSQLLSESYENFYTDATLSGALTLLTETESIFGDGGFRLVGNEAENSVYSANGTFTPAETAKYLGASNSNLRFVVYNNGNAEVTLRIFGLSVSIAPQTSAVFNGGQYGYAAALQGWGLIGTDGNLNAIAFSAMSALPVDLKIGRFTVNQDSFV